MMVVTGRFVMVGAGAVRVIVTQRLTRAVILGQQEACGGGHRNAGDKQSLSFDSHEHDSFRLQTTPAVVNATDSHKHRRPFPSKERGVRFVQTQTSKQEIPRTIQKKERFGSGSSWAPPNDKDHTASS